MLPKTKLFPKRLNAFSSASYHDSALTASLVLKMCLVFKLFYRCSPHTVSKPFRTLD